ALTTLIVNKQRGIIRPVVVKAPAFGEPRKQMLLDLAALTGGRVISEETGRRLDSATLADLGQARRLVATQRGATVVDGYGPSERIEERIGQIRVQMAAPTNSDLDREKLRERLAGLSGGVGGSDVRPSGFALRPQARPARRDRRAERRRSRASVRR